ncbi:uncharacterized protein LOC143775064 [Ranitomeya variabilis]|uniref:uncharacterized protein LOC143775064 n=1 Tax=Ranitomeya variabilis TaxID=490064 RepID=UPI004055FCCC
MVDLFETLVLKDMEALIYKKAPSNLTDIERRALNDIVNWPDVIVRPADKGGSRDLAVNQNDIGSPALSTERTGVRDVETSESPAEAVCDRSVPGKNGSRQQAVEDVMRRLRSIRDQYRRERQQRARSGAFALTKRKYIYYDRLSFLDPSMDLRPTPSNLTERETGSDSEAITDPFREGEEVAGPSSDPSCCIPPGPSAAAPEAPPTTGPDAAPAPVSQEDTGNSSSPTVPLEASPQPAVISRRGRRR